MLTLNTNISALSSRMGSMNASRDAAKAMQNLSTGKRINSAADDIAGLAISTRLSTQILGTHQALRNANDGISLLQTADGAAASILNILQRARELSVQAETYQNPADKTSILKEIEELQKQISSTIQSTQFNEKNILQGNGTSGTQKYTINLDGDSNSVAFSLPDFATLTTPLTTPQNTSTNAAVQIAPMSVSVASNTSDLVVAFSKKDLPISPPSPTSVIVADLNNDQNQDIIIQTAAGASILLSSGSASFSQISNTITPFASAAIADFNGDNIPDLATGDVNSTLQIMLGLGDGTFVLQTTDRIPSTESYNIAYAGPSRAYNETLSSITTNDWDGDGKVDLIINMNRNGISGQFARTLILSGNGNGSFTNKNPQVSTPPPNVNPILVQVTTPDPNYYSTSYQSLMGLTTGDFNIDGKIDVATTGAKSPLIPPFSYDINGNPIPNSNALSNYPGFVSVLLQTGLPYAMGGYNAGLPGGGEQILSKDLDGDGKLDLVVPNYTGAGGVSILKGRGDGTFDLPFTVAAGGMTKSVAIADFNNDSIWDIATANETENNISLLFGNGDLSFKSAINITNGSGPNSVVAGDWNNDGLMDLATTNNNSNSISLLMNESNYPALPPPPPPPPSPEPTQELSLLVQLDEYISNVLTARSQIGSYVNALTSAVDELANKTMNLQSSRSRIADTDYAQATTELTKNQILEKASMAMMAQANQNPYDILKLIKN